MLRLNHSVAKGGCSVGSCSCSLERMNIFLFMACLWVCMNIFLFLYFLMQRAEAEHADTIYNNRPRRQHRG